MRKKKFVQYCFSLPEQDV